MWRREQHAVKDSLPDEIYLFRKISIFLVDGQSQNQGQGIEPAVQYVQKVKQRCDADTYKQFLQILSRYHRRPVSTDEREVHTKISRLFKDHPDLRYGFRIFMPEKSQSMWQA
ncbi:hypothetical protein FIBSPDRAFT_842133 [Athelia psychrophila]|uniref:Uncharacterized protein n=1 Tax=Athelia psychrophila TaxID=1759441 RepID=A0A167WRG8_9AGAM|nr:hypothetical protein FIBSPDRAFT_842133 [Fibularhizoctonia sp. CBS 109695]